MSGDSGEQQEGVRGWNLADLERRQFEVSLDPDVADDAQADAVWKLDFLSTRKLHFKHVLIHLQRQLQDKVDSCLR